MDVVTLGAALNGSKKYTDQVEQSLESNLSLKANASDVNTATANLQNQINQIEISASAESVVAPEVAAARVGDDGTSYTTLKERLDTEIGDTNNNVSEIYSEVFKEPNNLYEGAIKSGGYYGSTGGWTENDTYKMAELPVGAVSSGDTLTFSPEFAYYKTSYMFDVLKSDGTWIKHYNLSEYKPVTIIVDDNVGSFYVAMRIRAVQDESNLLIVNNGQLEKESRIDKLADTLIPAKNKTIDCLGDSFTAPADSWCKKLAERIGCVCNNYGVASSRISVDTAGALSFLSRYDSMDTSADIVIIFGGINDAASIKTGDITLGDMMSELDDTTFYGALRLLIENIKSYMQGKKIIGVVPPDFVPNDNYASLPQIQEACRTVYDYYGVPFADLKKDCQEMYEDEYNNSVYRKVPENSNYHPSEKGHIAISEVIQGTIEKYIKA